MCASIESTKSKMDNLYGLVDGSTRTVLWMRTFVASSKQTRAPQEQQTPARKLQSAAAVWRMGGDGDGAGDPAVESLDRGVFDLLSE